MTKIAISFLAIAFFLFFPSSAFAANSGIFSMELWVKPTSSVASQTLVGKSEEMRMFTDASGNPGCQIKTTTWQTAVSSSTAITLNSWSFVSCTYDKTNLKIYVNGVQTGSQALTTTPDDTAAAFEIGEDDSASTPYSNLTGSVDGFEFYNYALTAKQVVSDMNAGHSAVGSPAGSSVGHWKFDEGVDNTCSGGSNDACNSGSAGSTLDGAGSGFASPATAASGWTQSGKFGRALIYDGTNDFVQVTDNDALDIGSGDFSVSAWFLRNTNATTNLRLMSKGCGADDQKGWAFWGSDTSIASCIGNGTARITSSGNHSGTSSWSHVVMTIKRNDKMYLYINGRLVTSKDISSYGTTDLGTTYNFFLGRDAAASQLYWPGTIDEVKIYNYALTTDEVKTEYNRGSSLVLGSLSDNSSYQVNAANQEYCIPGDSGTCSAPVAAWSFEEGSGGTAYDKSGNAYNGTWNGTGARYTAGKAGKGAKFNGTDDYIAVGNINKTLNTFSAWFKPSSAITASSGGLATVATFVDGAGHNADIWIQLGNSTGVCTNEVITIIDTLNNKRTCVTDITIPAGWNHLEVVWNSGSSRYDIYLNGSLQTVTAGTSTHVGQITVSNLEFAYKQSTPEFADSYANYTLDKAIIFDYARSAAQVQWDYNKSAPIGWWKFDDCQGTTAQDSTENNNDGTITIGATGGEDTVGTCTTSSTAWGSGATGKRNYSLSLDGTDDYISITDTANLRFDASTADFSLFAWVKRTTTGTEYIISKEDADNDGYRLLFTSSNTVQCSEDATDVTSTSAITDTNWHFVGCTIDRDGNGQVYIDGRADGSTASMGTDAMATTSNITIGTRSYTSTSYLNGQVDDVKIFNYALTATQVKNNMNDGAVRFGPSTGSP